jgi:hypothetical protein
MKKQYVQGDVILVPVETMQGKKQERTERGYVLADGESTGHAHTVQDEIEMMISDAGMFVASETPFTITHEEHKPITVPPGKYEVKRVQEYDHFKEEARQVAD